MRLRALGKRSTQLGQAESQSLEVQAGLLVVEDHHSQLVHYHRWAEVRNRRDRHTQMRGDLIGQVLDQAVDPRAYRKRVIQRQLLPPPDHALQLCRYLIHR